jgi:hypothetical protein
MSSVSKSAPSIAWIRTNFARAIAKIGYCQAVAIFG